MEYKSRSTGKILFAGLLAAASSMAGASTVFAPTDGDVNFIDFFGLFGGSVNTLALFDDSDTAYSGSFLSIPLPGIVTFTAGGINSRDFTATNEGGATFNLSGSDHFILGSFTPGVGWSGDVDATPLGANSYVVQFSDGLVVNVDVQVVPVPAAVWLFGSGLLGFAVIGRRRNVNRIAI